MEMHSGTQTMNLCFETRACWYVFVCEASREPRMCLPSRKRGWSGLGKYDIQSWVLIEPSNFRPEMARTWQSVQRPKRLVIER